MDSVTHERLAQLRRGASARLEHDRHRCRDVHADAGVWTRGRIRLGVWRGLGRRTEAGPKDDYPLLRHYGGEGQLLGAELNRSSMAHGAMPNYHPRVSDGAAAFLDCSAEGVGLFAARGPLGSAGFILALKRNVAAPLASVVTRMPEESPYPTGFVYVANTRVFVSVAVDQAQPHRTQPWYTRARWWKAAPAGTYEVVTQGGRATWIPVTADDPDGVLIGHEGNHVVRVRKASSASPTVSIARVAQ